MLPEPAITSTRYGLGFTVIHQAEMFNQIIIDWWERENELRHHVFKADPEAPTDFQNITSTGEAFCVWEIKVIGFERDAWLRHMIDSEGNPAPEAYLKTRLNIDA